MKGATTVVGVVTDAATGEALGLEVLVERDSDGFMEWCGDFVSDYGVEAIAAGRPEYIQAGSRASGNRASDLHSPRAEVGVEPSRRDRRLGLDQGENMAAADGAAL